MIEVIQALRLCENAKIVATCQHLLLSVVARALEGSSVATDSDTIDCSEDTRPNAA
jgi:hypothetical protein